VEEIKEDKEALLNRNHLEAGQPGGAGLVEMVEARGSE
jgi:hypothetical protein